VYHCIDWTTVCYGHSCSFYTTTTTTATTTTITTITINNNGTTATTATISTHTTTNVRLLHVADRTLQQNQHSSRRTALIQ